MDGPVVEKRQGRHSAARGVKTQGREPCHHLWCGSGENKEQGRESCCDLWCCRGDDKSSELRGGGGRCRDGDGIGGSDPEDVASETAKITSPSARRRSDGRQRGGALWHSATDAARERWEELVHFSSVAI